jgi:hypothetical protein
MSLDEENGGLRYNEKRYNDLEKAIKMQKQIDGYNSDRENDLMNLLKDKEKKEEKEWKEVSPEKLQEMRESLGDSEGVVDRADVNIANSLTELEEKREKIPVLASDGTWESEVD